jgi:pimeloyl-ACP methyl ester carboxylesterase
MPLLSVNGLQLHYVEKGAGEPVVFLHELSGNAESWSVQLRRFARRYRAIAFNARGYPPSSVPDEADRYGLDFAVADLRGLLDGLAIDRAHIVGLSMGAYTALVFALRHPDRVRGLVVASSGNGSSRDPAASEGFLSGVQAHADRIMAEWGPEFIVRFGNSPNRRTLMVKDPKGHARYLKGLKRASPVGFANTLRRVLGERPSLFSLEDRLRAMTLPTLLICGDEDEGCIEGNIFLKKTIKSAGLAMMPRTGHLMNLEEPAEFNRIVENFLAAVDNGALTGRDA